jgi:hypothetical protein
MLTGIPTEGDHRIATALRKGDTVAIRIRRLDPAAVTAMAAALDDVYLPTVYEDGIVEDVLSDSNWGREELLDAVLATLADRKDPVRSLTFTSRDPSLEVGRTVTITLTTPPISGTYRIQRITLSEIAIGGKDTKVFPLRQVEASSKLYSFNDLLRRRRGLRAGAD